MYVVTPTLDRIREIQEEEHKYYWSAAAESLLRGRGVISSATVHGVVNPLEGAAVVTRGCSIEAAEAIGAAGPRFYEGPLAKDLAASFGVAAIDWEEPEVELSCDGAAISIVRYPTEYSRDASGAVLPANAPEEWRNATIRGQFLDAPGWTVVATARSTTSGASGPVVVTRDSTTLCGIPLLDIGVRHTGFPPVSDRYEIRDTGYGHEQALDLALGPLLAKGAAGAPMMVVSRWPKGCDACITVRHDYDRDISKESALELLDYYRDNNLKCSIAFLSYLAPPPMIEAFAAAGHEIQLHSHARDGSTLAQARAVIEAIAKRPVRGMTIHGGGTGVGFLGDRHYAWALGAGLDYAETFSDTTYPAIPIPRIGKHGIPELSRLLGVAPHRSLDLSMQPEHNELELFRTLLPTRLLRGDHVILMNHPDVHRQELLELLGLLDLDRVWRATQLEAVEWFRTTHFEAEAEIGRDRARVRFPRAPSKPVEVTVHWADGTRTVATIEDAEAEIAYGATDSGAARRPDPGPARPRDYAEILNGYAGHTPTISPILHGALPRSRSSAGPEYRHPAPFDQSYFRGRAIGDAVAQSDHRGLGFRGMAQSLRLPERALILDVGAGGFAGATTTAHLVERWPGRVHALEIRPERAQALHDKLGGRITIEVGDFYTYAPDQPFDLVVLDLDTSGHSRQYYEGIPKARGLLEPAGKVIASLIYDCDAAFGGAAPLFKPEARGAQEAFMQAYFGTTTLSLETARRVMWGHGFAALGMTDKWLSATAAGRGFGWILLERL